MSEPSHEALTQSIIDMAVEAWRFRGVFKKVLSRLDAGEETRYIGQYNWFYRKVEAALEKAQLKIVNVEGQIYDIGMAATPINIDDFDNDDVLFVEQMIEPIIMDQTKVVKTGTIVLRRE